MRLSTPDRDANSAQAVTISRILPLLLYPMAGMGTVLIAVLWTSGETAKSAYYIPALMLISSSVAFIKRTPGTARFLVLTLGIVVGLQVTEVGLRAHLQIQMSRDIRSREEYAKSQGRKYDFRTQGEFIVESRQQGSAIYPAFPRGHTLRSGSDNIKRGIVTINGREIVPLGSISNVTTVYGNETGEYLVYQSDEHGFHNPLGIWDESQVDVAVVGDSFAHGASVPSDRNIAAMIRQHFPKTLNLGHGGNGPLSELGTILEYLPQRRPRVVLWLYCASNDVSWDLDRESQTPVLVRYLNEPLELQGLEELQPQIDLQLKEYVDSRLPGQAKKTIQLRSWIETIALTDLRSLVWALGRVPEPDYATLARVLARARDIVETWGGKFVLVDLPEKERVDSKKVHRICADLGVPVIDVRAAFDLLGDRAGAYFYPYKGHYTPEGYEHAGRSILDEIQRRFL